MLSAKQLEYAINGKQLIHDVSLTVGSGQFFALIGPNGAGKSTLLRLLSGEFTPSSGTISLKGQPIDSYSRREMALLRSVMAQRETVSFDFPVYDVVMLGRHPHIQRNETPRDHQIVKQALRRTEASELSDRFFGTLSSGEQARVTFARILAQEAELLLLDEPTSTLDLRHQQLVMMIASEIAAQGGTVIAIVHDLNLAATYADQIGILKNGKLLAIGDPNQVLTESNLHQAFDLPTLVMPHPNQDRPLIVPMPLK